MADLVLSDGREVTFDLGKITHKEYLEFWGRKTPAARKGEILQKICGLTLAEVDENLSEMDWRRFKAKLEEVSFRPIAEDLKNSPSASS